MVEASFIFMYPCVTSYLQPSIQRPLNGHTLAGMGSIGGNGRDEGVELVFFLLEFLHQALDGPLCERLALAALPVTHQAVHDAQTGVVARRCVGDGHGDFLCLDCVTFFRLLYYVIHTVSHNQEAPERRKILNVG